MIGAIERFEGTSKLTLQVDDGTYTVETTRPLLGWKRLLVSVLGITFAICVAGVLAYPYLWFQDGNGAIAFGAIAYVILVMMLFADRYTRKNFRRYVRFQDGRVRLFCSDEPNRPHTIDFVPRQVVVTTTIPLLRSNLVFYDKNRKAIVTGESTPYYQRYFIGKRIADAFDADFIAERTLTDSEALLIESLT